MKSAEVGQLVTELGLLDRQALENRLLSLKGSFQFDFTPEYISSLSNERLRHILLAACLYVSQGGTAIAAHK